MDDIILSEGQLKKPGDLAFLTTLKFRTPRVLGRVTNGPH